MPLIKIRLAVFQDRQLLIPRHTLSSKFRTVCCLRGPAPSKVAIHAIESGFGSASLDRPAWHQPDFPGEYRGLAVIMSLCHSECANLYKQIVCEETAPLYGRAH